MASDESVQSVNLSADAANDIIDSSNAYWWSRLDLRNSQVIKTHAGHITVYEVVDASTVKADPNATTLIPVHRR
jgi:hypothetical protein